MWGGLPYRKYVFLNVITESSGGLEHNNSLCVMTNRWLPARAALMSAGLT